MALSFALGAMRPIFRFIFCFLFLHCEALFFVFIHAWRGDEEFMPLLVSSVFLSTLLFLGGFGMITLTGYVFLPTYSRLRYGRRRELEEIHEN